MRNLEDIEKDLSAAREALLTLEGTPAEVYSRIVGYYRSVRNWNRGKREEYGERKLYRIGEMSPAAPSPSSSLMFPEVNKEAGAELMLFIRSSCPSCPAAKREAEKLGIYVEFINADTPDGLAAAQKWNVLSTPTAILLSSDGNELDRARNAKEISRMNVQPVPLAV